MLRRQQTLGPSYATCRRVPNDIYCRRERELFYRCSRNSTGSRRLSYKCCGSELYLKGYGGQGNKRRQSGMRYRTKELAVLGSPYIRHGRVCTCLAILTNERASPKVIGKKKGNSSGAATLSRQSPNKKAIQSITNRKTTIFVLELQISASISLQSN